MTSPGGKRVWIDYTRSFLKPGEWDPWGFLRFALRWDFDPKARGDQTRKNRL